MKQRETQHDSLHSGACAAADAGVDSQSALSSAVGAKWYRQRRFGMFIHWGIYAEGGLHEQELWRYGTSWENYAGYAARFNPVAFDPAAILDFAQSCGMGYLVFTAKHHDGFCMFDTACTDWKITNTPYGRDVFRMLADECHRREFPLEAYYSVVDWHHEAYPNLGGHHEIVTDPGRHDLPKYIAYLKEQIRELCTNYGKIHGIWWDMNTTKHQDESVNAMIRSLQPEAIINDRGLSPGDFGTMERTAPPDQLCSYLVEGCESVGHFAWGYRKDEKYYTPRFLKRKIAMTIARGGNFVLNTGLDALGRIPDEARAVMREVGEWYRRVSPALTAIPQQVYRLPGVSITGTEDGRTLYLILDDIPGYSDLELPFDGLPPLESAVLLNDGRALAVDNSALYVGPFPPRRAVCGVPLDCRDIYVIQVNFAGPLPAATGKGLEDLPRDLTLRKYL